MGDYLKSQTATTAIEECLLTATGHHSSELPGPNSEQLGEVVELGIEASDSHGGPSSQERRKTRGKQIRARTARRWLKRMGLSYRGVGKAVYFDGHEREDVVTYRNNVFLPAWEKFQERMVQFSEDGTWRVPDHLPPGEKPLVLVTHDESTFNANDGKRRLWLEDGKQPLRPKGRGKGIMVSGFLTPGGRLRVPDNIPDTQLLEDCSWPLQNGKPVRDAMHYLEYGKDNYWTGDKMVEHTIKAALPIFRWAFPGCQAVFAFDNASNHSAFAPDALLASQMNLNPGGKQPHMRDGFIHSKQRPQPMSFPPNHSNPTLRGKPKGAEQVLRERGRWRNRRSDGFVFLLQCPRGNGRPGCNPGIEGGCCA